MHLKHVPRFPRRQGGGRKIFCASILFVIVAAWLQLVTFRIDPREWAVQVSFITLSLALQQMLVWQDRR